MSLPANVIPRSTRVYLSVIGDSIGPVLKNLDNLVQQPTGCGEQNMVKFAPIISVANYLKETQQLEPKLENLMKEYLRTGYQRQLTYRHKDGSFSAFGPGSTNEGGGTWLTAFVLRCLAGTFTSNHIAIDIQDIKLSLKMLSETQDNDGSFRQVGAPLFSKALAGGLKNKKAGLSAYVMVSILKSITALDSAGVKHDSDIVLSKGLEFLRTSVQDLETVDIYTLALVNYVFKSMFIEDELIQKLDKELDVRAIRENDYIYWSENENDKQKKENEKSWFNPQSADLETTSYILLSKLTNLKDEDLVNLIPIAKWINSKRNSHGGFYSTQDTVLALEALTKFSSATYSKNVNLRLTYTFNGVKNRIFIKDINRLLVQKLKLEKFNENDSNSFSFDVEGSGTALVQVIFKYNLFDDDTITFPKDNFEFSIFSSKPLNEESVCTQATLNITARYSGSEEASSMAIISIRLPSGWEPVESSIQSLTDSQDLKRFELNENKINLYFDQLTQIEKKFAIEVVKKYDIKDTKPGQISVYDYYEPLEYALTQQFEIGNYCQLDNN